jgi:hypothetical protein
MHIPPLSTLSESYKLLKQATGFAPTRSQFFETIISHSLPLQVVCPANIKIAISNSRGGSSIDETLTSRRMALLLTSHIKELWAHGDTYTSIPAWRTGDAEFMSWQAIKERRVQLGNSAITAQPMPKADWNDGEFMGESRTAFFTEKVKVNDKTCRVPCETIEELCLIFNNVHSQTKKIPAINKTPLTSTRHVLKNRSSYLDSEIAIAVSMALNPDNVESVFAELCKMADTQQGCLVEAVDDTIKYRKGAEIVIFQKRYLLERMKRAKTR